MNPTLDFENEKTTNDRFLGPHHETMTVVPVDTNNATLPSTTTVIQEYIANDKHLQIVVQPKERKCCRICFDEEEEEEEDAASDHDPMIAPCMCKGSSKWVHRTCLDRWRMNEPDRAFAQCTESFNRIPYKSTASPVSIQSPIIATTTTNITTTTSIVVVVLESTTDKILFLCFT